MARLSYFERDDIPPELARRFGDQPLLNLFRVLPHAPPAANGFVKLGSALLRRSSLDPQLRELVILRVGALSRASYEIHQHVRVGQNVGLGPEQIAAALREGPERCLDDLARVVLRFTDAVVADVKAPAALYGEVAALLTEREMLELLMTIGYYMLVSRVLENLEVDIEPATVEGLTIGRDGTHA